MFDFFARVAAKLVLDLKRPFKLVNLFDSGGSYALWKTELLHTQRAKFSIAEDFKKAQDNYATALQVVDRDSDVDFHFIAVMDMLNSIPIVHNEVNKYVKKI